MNRIEVSILHESHESPAGMMMFLAKLTQRGHKVSDMSSLRKLYNSCINNQLSQSTKAKEIAVNIATLPHGTIKRFAPITIAIVGASRRFLAQARTHQIGINYVSASLQYSDYSGKADFVVPYELLSRSWERTQYLESCTSSMSTYERLIEDGVSNDTAGYAAPQGLRNILVIQANHEAWLHFIRTRACNRNTTETQYVTMKIWEALLEASNDGDDMFLHAGPDCIDGRCREGKLSCNKSLQNLHPRVLLDEIFPLVMEVEQ